MLLPIAAAALPWLTGFTPVEPAEGSAATLSSAFDAGVVVYDRRGTELAHTAGFAPQGSADELVTAELGDGQLGAPMLAVVVTLGGHRVSTTSLVLYRLDRTDERGELAPLFSEPIEERDGDSTTTGWVTLIAGALLYDAPDGGGPTLWLYDARAGAYRATGVNELVEPRDESAVAGYGAPHAPGVPAQLISDVVTP